MANFVYTFTIQVREVLDLGCAGCPATGLGIHPRMTAGAVDLDRRAVGRIDFPEVPAHTDLHRAVPVRTDHQMEAARTDPAQALGDTVQDPVDRNHLEGLTDVLVGAGRTAVGAEMNSWIRAESHAGCIGHVKEHCVHTLPGLELCRIAMCYAVVTFGHIALVAAEDCTSSGVIDLHTLLRHFGAAMEAGIVKTTGVVQTACSLKAVRCRCMFHSVRSRCIRNCCSAKNRGNLHQGCLQAYHSDHPMSAAESSVVLVPGCEACFLHP